MDRSGDLLVSLMAKWMNGKYMRFFGNIEAKLDQKGRAFFPVVFRKILQEENGSGVLVLRKDVYQPCIVIYPEAVWNSMIDNLRSKLNMWNCEHQQIYRQFVSDVEVIKLDSSGRLLIPGRYRAMANLEQNVNFIGMDEYVELWGEANMQKPFMEIDEFKTKLQEIINYGK